MASPFRSISTLSQVFIKEAKSVFWFSLLSLWEGEKASKR
jgi:hypothetical protein